MVLRLYARNYSKYASRIQSTIKLRRCGNGMQPIKKRGKPLKAQMSYCKIKYPGEIKNYLDEIFYFVDEIK